MAKDNGTVEIKGVGEVEEVKGVDISVEDVEMLESAKDLANNKEEVKAEQLDNLIDDLKSNIEEEVKKVEIIESTKTVLEESSIKEDLKKAILDFSELVEGEEFNEKVDQKAKENGVDPQVVKRGFVQAVLYNLAKVISTILGYTSQFFCTVRNVLSSMLTGISNLALSGKNKLEEKMATI